MRSFPVCLALCLPLLAVLPSACKQKQEPVAAPSAPAYRTLARLHWLGKQRIAAETNSAYFLSLWNMPEAVRLQNQTLDKLASGPGVTNNTLAQATNSQLRPLLDDLVESESRLEIREAPGKPTEAVLAIKLPENRAQLWRSNLAEVETQGRLLPGFPAGSKRLEVLAMNGWLTVGLPGSSALASNLLSRANATLSPPAGTNTQPTNYWLEATLDAKWLLEQCGLNLSLPAGLPQLHLTSIGEGDYVRTRANLDFPRPLNLRFEPWTVPTNLIREPLISFTAVQGFEPLLASVKLLQDLKVNPVPNQLFVWALGLSDVQTFAAVPLTNAIAQMDRIGPELEARINSCLTNVALGAAEFSPTNHGIGWVPVPMFTPVFQGMQSPDGELLYGRLGSVAPPARQMAPPELLSHLTDSTNLVCYDWEITQARVQQWIFLGQSVRLALKRTQLAPSSAAFEWLQAVAPKLGNTVTEVVSSGPSTLNLTRKSHIGLTGFELHLLADWLESPRFPESTYTVLAPPAQMLRWRAKSRTFEPETNRNQTVTPGK